MGKCVIISIRKAKLASIECVAVALTNRYDIVGSCRRIIELKGIFVSLNGIRLDGACIDLELPIATGTGNVVGCGNVGSCLLYTSPSPRDS